MPVRRLYIGGLSQEIDGATLGSKLAKYGAVENIDMKEKSDLDGNVVQRFAYVNIEAHPSQLEECIQQLNGASWLGSQLRVEPAKESFLDRLKREQASRNQNQVSAPQYQNQGRASDYQSQGRDSDYRNQGKDSDYRNKGRDSDYRNQGRDSDYRNQGRDSDYRNQRRDSDYRNQGRDSDYRNQGRDSQYQNQRYDSQYQKGYDSQYQNKGYDSQYQNPIRPAECESQESFSQNMFNKKDVSAPASHDVNKKKERKEEQFQEEESGIDVEPIKKKKKRKKNKEEEEILSSFKSYSSVWGDTDSEEDKPPKKSWKESHTGDQKKTKESVVHKTKASKGWNVESSSENDAPADVEAPASNCKDIREEHRAQLAILDKLEASTSPEQPVEEEPTSQNTTAEKEEKPDEKNMYVHVAKDLKFGQTPGFSLLAQFSQQREEEIVEEKEAAPVMPIQPWTPAERQEKKRSFFVAPDDILIRSAVEWMAQSVTDAVVQEFSKVQPELRELFKTRATTIKRDLVDRSRGRGKKRGRGSGSRRNMSSDDRGRVTFVRDDRWRERGEETKRSEKAVK